MITQLNTIDQAFEMLQDAIYKNADSIRVEYDAQL
jgi:hypothetical protein